MIRPCVRGVGFLFLALSGVAAQSPPAVVDISKDLEVLARARKIRRGTADGYAIERMQKLRKHFPTLDKKNQVAVSKAMRLCLLAKRKPDNAKLLETAADALSSFGTRGGDVLAAAIEHKRYKTAKPWRSFRAHMIRCLGKVADKKFVKRLIDIARKDNDDGAAAAAGGALGNYAKAPSATRKRIVKELLKNLEGTNSVASTLGAGSLGGSGGGGGNPALAASKRLRKIRGPWMRTLRRLTGQNHKRVIDWRKWHEKNKRKRW